MNDAIIVGIITVIGSGAVSILASFLLFRSSMYRNKAQNQLDGSQTALNALEVAERATEQNKILLERIESMESILKGQRYKLVVIFAMGENPQIEQATLEMLTPIHSV